MDSISLKTVDILGVRVTAEPLSAVLAAIRGALKDARGLPKYVCATSVHGIIEAQRDPDFRNMLNRAFINHPDGLPLVKMGRWLGERQMEQIKGPLLFPLVCDTTADENVRHFFYGGKEGVAEALAKNMQLRVPHLKVAGTYCPPFRELTADEEEAVVRKINQSQADVLWVGLSTPKQERWIARHYQKLHVKLCFSVGAAFDFHTGGISFAPNWVSRIGLEWLYRLWMEPRRLWRRYFRIVPIFMVLGARQLLGQKGILLGFRRRGKGI